jgi:hypothetical protein
MTGDSRWNRARISPRLSVAIAIVGIVCMGTLCNSEVLSQNVIKRKLVIAQDLQLDVPGGNLQGRLTQSPSGLASLAFFDVRNKRSIGLTIQESGTPSFFLSTNSPKTLTSLKLAPSGSASLHLGAASVLDKTSLLPGFWLLHDPALMLIDDNSMTRVSIAPASATQARSSIALLHRNGKLAINFTDGPDEVSGVSLDDGEGISRTLFSINHSRVPSLLFGDSKKRPRLVLHFDGENRPRIVLFDPDNKHHRTLE